MSALIRFDYVSMCWNAHDVQPFAFDNTMPVKKDHPVDHLLAWTAVVARGAPGGQLKALVINCHGLSTFDYTSTTDSSGGAPRQTGGWELAIGKGIKYDDAYSFVTLAGLVRKIHVYACRAGTVTPPLRLDLVNRKFPYCQIMADVSRAVVVASDEDQPDNAGPGLNLAPPMVGRVTRFVPCKQ